MRSFSDCMSSHVRWAGLVGRPAGQEDAFVASLSTDRPLGAPELLGKVFSAMPAPSNSSATGAVKFA